MAVVEAKNPSSLKVKLDLGMVDGKTKVRSKTFSNLKHDANAQDVYDVAESLMALQEYEVLETIKIDNTTLA
ncbi:DUF1659 domain-containing protein [Romboutsia sp. 13368]|uniref:DUF1659 domain-containing protein n=1 Tax=Romboutsia sp. 13368 TaxID=2708053 RepID=UPI0025CDCF12|nr:DUF1659 domain-containing protein [Romboutsia sp. 13368]